MKARYPAANRLRRSNAGSPRHCVDYHKWYAGLALFSELGVARLEGILP